MSHESKINSGSSENTDYVPAKEGTGRTKRLSFIYSIRNTLPHQGERVIPIKPRW
jgi:hypothetical protein